MLHSTALHSTLTSADIPKLKSAIHEQGLSVIVASNPRNPTGQVLANADLHDLVRLAQEDKTTVILDEFYSWYLYDDAVRGEEGQSVSAARFVEDVNEEGVVIVNGLTKCWRLPGWRVAWVVGPKSLISALGQCGGYLDGGGALRCSPARVSRLTHLTHSIAASHPLQVAAIPLLSPQRVKQDTLALQQHFHQKRDHVLSRLTSMGLHVPTPPTSTFYIWLDLSQLPAPLDSGFVFFEALLREKVIVTPGSFFDLNPAHRRNLFDSPCQHFVRLSYGPALEELDRGAFLRAPSAERRTELRRADPCAV